MLATDLRRLKAHSHRTKAETKKKIFFDIYSVIFLACSFSLSLSLSLGVNRPLKFCIKGLLSPKNG